jgi:hypothetical protein
MATGKQLSFSYGEIAPTLQFRSNAVAYGQGAGKLKNFYVRRTGGVANRPGFVFKGNHPYQGAIPRKGGQAGIAGYVTVNPDGTETLIEYYQTDPTYYSFRLNNGAPSLVNNDYTVGTGIVKPHELRFTDCDEYVMVTPTLRFFGLPYYVNPIYDKVAKDINTINGYFSFSDGNVDPSSTRGYRYSGAPYMECSYLVSKVFRNNTEEFILATFSEIIANPNTPPATGVVFPTPTVQSFLKLVFTSATAYNNVKYFNIYRSSGRDLSFPQLVGRVFYQTGGTTMTFDDFGGSDPTISAPLDCSILIGKTRQGPVFDPISLFGVKTAGYYQQRMLVSFQSSLRPDMPRGTVGASVLGGTREFKMPSIFNNLGAFTFNVPVADGTEIVGQLAMERHIVITEKAAYVIRGGEQGALTPTTVNPLMISSEGGSPTVEPKMKARRGFYLNRDHTKLMSVVFGEDGNLNVEEISLSSEHLLGEEIWKMEVIGGREDIVYLLKRDGTMVCISIGQEGVGFSRVDTDGFIENIYTRSTQVPWEKVSRPFIEGVTLAPLYEVLYAYVIRGGVRRVEYLERREDDFREREFYVDSGVYFGKRLSALTTGGFQRFETNGVYMLPSTTDPLLDSSAPDTRANISLYAGASYDAGEELEVQFTCLSTDIPDLGDPTKHIRMDFYYEDSAGEVKKIRFVPTQLPSSWVPVDLAFTHSVLGYFEQDVPAELQNVELQSLSSDLKLDRQTRWLFAYKFLNVMHLADKKLAITAEGVVLSSPNNIEYPALEADTNGIVELPDFYSWGTAGLPYACEFESLDLEVGDERTLTDKRKLITGLGVAYYNTRCGQAGSKEEADPLPVLFRDDGGTEDTTANFSGFKDMSLAGSWEKTGRVRILQNDPAPMTILSIYPKGLSGE